MFRLSLNKETKKLKSIAILFFLSFSVVSADSTNASEKIAKQPSLSISNGWIRLMPPVSKNTAAYFTLYNQSDKTIVVEAMSTTLARHASLHTVIEEDGMSSMEALDELIIAAGEKVIFAPGGKHLMLMGLTEKLQGEKNYEFFIVLKNGEQISVSLQCYRTSPYLKEE